MYFLNKTPIADCTKMPSWTSIPDAIHRGIDLVSDYPTCKHLFRSLCNPADLQIAALVRSVGLVRPSQTTGEIIDALKSISQQLEGMEPKQAAAAVKSFKSKNVFPVSDHMSTLNAQTHDRRLCANDQSWFIYDDYEVHNCFAGRIPLLSAPPTAIPALDNLLSALKLKSRKLSEVVIKRSSPKGR